MESLQTHNLQESIATYETQLNQIKSALAVTGPGPEQDSLLGLKNNIEELIKLTKENILGLQQQSSEDVLPNVNDTTQTCTNSHSQDPFEDEYALFKAEIEKEESSDSKTSRVETGDITAVPDIKSELASLQGSKCQAPYTEEWNDEGKSTFYHNALVMSIEEIDGYTNDIKDIAVKVMYTNPIHKKMVPCPFFLEGDCKFDDDKCRFSHGQIIPFADLREYKEPDFSSIKVGCRVLAKQHQNSLWQYASVLELISDEVIKVKFNASSGGTVEINLHDVLPLESDDNLSRKVPNGDAVDENDDDIKCYPIDDTDRESIVQLSLLRTPTSAAIGDWEKYTKGVGSRLMAKMGYIIGSGLGLRGEGRLEPVEALVFPPGKSLDHCMALREAAGGAKDMFKAEKVRLRKQMKEDKRRAKEYEKEKQKTDVFSFINNTLSGSPSSSSSHLDESKKMISLTSSSRKGLNVEKFCIGEDIRRAEKDLTKLKESLTRHRADSPVYKHIMSKVVVAETELNRLRASEHSISREQIKRDSTKKLCLF